MSRSPPSNRYRKINRTGKEHREVVTPEQQIFIDRALSFLGKNIRSVFIYRVKPVFSHDQILKLLNERWIIPYKTSNFYNAKVISDSISNVLHQDLDAKKINNTEYNKIIGGVILSTDESNSKIPRLWNPAHPIGKKLWDRLLKFHEQLTSLPYNEMVEVIKIVMSDGFEKGCQKLNLSDAP